VHSTLIIHIMDKEKTLQEWGRLLRTLMKYIDQNSHRFSKDQRDDIIDRVITCSVPSRGFEKLRLIIEYYGYT